MEDRLIGLYYPYKTFKNDAWFKLAALYWDKIGRIAPSDVLDASDTVKQLCQELDFVKNFQPSSQDKYIVGQMFLEVLSKYSSELVKFYSVNPRGGFAIERWKVDTGFWYELNEAGLIWTQGQSEGHLGSSSGKSSWTQHLPHDLLEVKQFGPKWSQSDASKALAFIGLDNYMTAPSKMDMVEEAFHLFHPRFALIYLEALAGQMAVARQMYPVTDNLTDHIIVGEYTIERLIQALLHPNNKKPHLGITSPTSHEIEMQMVTIALESVLPKDLAHIPVKKIIQLRQKHRDELTAFQSYLHKIASDLQGLQISDPEAIKAHLEVMYEKNLKPHLEDLKKCIHSKRMDTVTGVLNIRATLPPLLTSAGEYAAQAHINPANPLIVGGGALAFSVFSVIQKKRAEAQKLVQASPAAYLLYTEEALKPTTVISQVTQTARKMLFQV